MRKLYLFYACALLGTSAFVSCERLSDKNVIYATVEEEEGEEDEEKEGYDGPAQRDSLEFEKIKDPTLGYIPYNRLDEAIEYTEDYKLSATTSKTSGVSFNWQERGPIYDSLGQSNGNSRAGVNYTSGRIRAVLVDTLNDNTGNTVFAAGVAGGLWKCTNFLSTIPNWTPLDDKFDNMAISSICQDPSNPSILYFSTGEPSSNADAVYGSGLWKSTDKGMSWRKLPSTANMVRTFKLVCDASGNLFAAARFTTTPVAQPYGLVRSKDGGSTWTNITPKGLSSSGGICTDIEYTSTGKLHASFGYSSGVVTHKFSTSPATVTTTSGWNNSTGIRKSSTFAYRLEIAAIADTLYGITVNSAGNLDSIYKSQDGGANWIIQNTSAPTTGVLNTQGWYGITLAINPTDASQIIVGGLDAYKSVNNGSTFTKLTNWVTNAPYVHADHHFIQWWNASGENRILIASDGGLFLSRNGGAAFADKNRNLAIKQFYSAAIHPAAGSNYLLAGAQDNGTHQLKYAGLASSIEVTGGDGAYVHINQQNPNVQFGAYVYNQYRRSTNGGATWSSINWSNSTGLFINPFEYDDAKNIMYATWAANQVLRWPNATSGTSGTALTFTGLGTATAFKMSPYTTNRLIIGSNSGKVFRVNNADAAADYTNISSAGFPAGYINCVNVGSNDDNIVATFTNYGVNNVWVTTDGGTSWIAIDGNLPDMPVRWAVFVPGQDDKMILATEAGIYTTQRIDGSNTVWSPDLNFPTVRTDMLKIRPSDNTIVAATHGRGLFTATIPTVFGPEISFTTSETKITEQADVVSGCRSYKDYTVNISLDVVANDNTTALINILSGNNAKKGVDFDYTTNGDFTNPSNQLVYTTGQIGVKPISIRIYDDAEVETPETFTLSVSLSGASNAVLGYSRTHVVTINDNDFAPQVFGLRNYAIGSYNGDGIATSPFQGNKQKHKMQALYSVAELKAAGILPNASISAMTIKVLTKNSTKPFTGFTISMANVPTTTLSAGFTTAGTFTQVFSNDYSSVEGDNTFDFTTPFVWDGTSNVVVQYCFDNGTATTDPIADVMEGFTTPLGVGIRASTYSNYSTGTTSGCALPAASVNDFRINAVFGVTTGNHVATSLNTSKTDYLDAGSDIYYYVPTGEIIAKVHNLSGHVFGCTQVTIDRAGTGTSRFWNNNSKNYLMNKTFLFTPDANNQTANGKYEVTLYYTKEEKEGWESATGQSWNNIQLVKVPTNISNVTPSNAQPNGPGTVQVVNPIRGTYGTGYTLTYTYENGMSSIGAGMPGRMNSILTLAGRLDGTNVILDWTTSAEVNSANFELEKSYDGTNYHQIANVKASGNKLSYSTYSHTDEENVEVNYYRVKMTHTDTVAIVSNVVMIRNKNGNQRMMVLTNPFSDQIRLRFAQVPQTPLVFSLYDMNGKLIKKYNSPAGSQDLVFYNINTGNVYSQSIYMLDVLVDGKHYKAKLMRK